MFNYSTLESIGMEKLYKTFIEAFSDYQVKIDLPILKFQQIATKTVPVFVRGLAPWP